MADEYQQKYRIPSLTTDAIVLRKHKNDDFHDILLVTRGNDPYEGKLAFPGGFVEYGEEPQYGCIRELKEETELDGKDIELLTVRGNPKRDPRRHVVSIFYLVNVDQDAIPKGSDDAKDAKFYDLTDIIENKKEELAFDHYGVIEELVEKKYKDLYKNKDLGKLKNRKISNNNDLNIDNKKNLLLDIELNDVGRLKNLIKKQYELEEFQKETEKFYVEKLDNIRQQIDEMNKQKWEVFDEKVSKLHQIKKEKENLNKKIDELKVKLDPYSNKLKSEKVINKQNNTPNPVNIITNNNQNNLITEEKIKSKKKNIAISTDEKINNNSKNISVFVKVNQIIDKTVDNMKVVAKEGIITNSFDCKKEKIDKIKKITNDAIDEINKLTKYVEEQANALIKIINGNELKENILYNKIKKVEELKCEKCKKNYQYEIKINDKKDKNQSVHRGVRCNGCGAFIWENN